MQHDGGCVRLVGGGAAARARARADRRRRALLASRVAARHERRQRCTRDALQPLDAAYDLVAFDFYSRSVESQRRGRGGGARALWRAPREDRRFRARRHTHVLDRDVVGQRCARLFAHADAPCKNNLLEHWHTDLGANVINLRRWRAERRRFSAHHSDEGAQDGLLFRSLVYWGWRVKRVTAADSSGCLFDHNPNPHSCVLKGPDMIWDDYNLACRKSPNLKKFADRGYHLFHADATPRNTEMYDCRSVRRVLPVPTGPRRPGARRRWGGLRRIQDLRPSLV